MLQSCTLKLTRSLNTQGISRIVASRRLSRPISRNSSQFSTMATDGKYDYDLVTIGAGSGGVRGSRFAASYGKKVAVIELPFDFMSSDTKGGVGGTCVLRGCVPKKLMVYASEFASGFKESVGFGWEEREMPAHTWTKFMEAKRKELHRLNGAYKNTLKNAGVELIEGRGKLIDGHTVDIDGKKVTAQHVLIAVGGTPVKLDIPGAEHCITSDGVLELAELPKKVVVVGGGYIAVEFASIFNRMGADTHLIYRADRPLRGFDEEVRKFATEQYEVAGMKLHPETNPVEVTKQADGKLTCVIKLKDGSLLELKDNDAVVMATGRNPKINGLGLEDAGVKIGKRGEVVVDEFCCTSVPSVFAVGDVIGRIALTPVALMEGMAVAKTIAKGQPTAPEYEAIASAVFSYPELCSVGLTEEAAIKALGDVDIYSSSFKAMKNTLSGSPMRTLMKLVVDSKTDKVVGLHIVGDHAAEITQGFAVAIKIGVTKTQLDSVVGIHPSAAEELVTMRTATRQIRK